MNKQGKTDNKVIAIVIVLALILVLFLWYSGTGKTILEHRQPADISQEEEGTGLDLRLYDEDGNEIEIPDWFSTATDSKVGIFSIVRHPPAPTCTTRTQCAGYDTNPNIGCWEGKCVLQNIGSMDLGVSVTNPIASEVAFLNVAPSAASPTIFNTNLDKTVTTTLLAGQTASWMTTAPMSVGVWEGTQQVFSISVSGTNEYTGETFTAGDSITLAFDANPAGAFTVSIVSPI